MVINSEFLSVESAERSCTKGCPLKVPLTELAARRRLNLERRPLSVGSRLPISSGTLYVYHASAYEHID
jgi:hypothetical protein